MGITGYCLGQPFNFLDLLPHGVIWMAEVYPTILWGWSYTGLATLHTSANDTLFSTFAIRTVCMCCFDSESIRAFCRKRRGLKWSFHSKRKKNRKKEKLVISNQKIGCMWHIKLLFNHVCNSCQVNWQRNHSKQRLSHDYVYAQLMYSILPKCPSKTSPYMSIWRHGFFWRKSDA